MVPGRWRRFGYLSRTAWSSSTPQPGSLSFRGPPSRKGAPKPYLQSRETRVEILTRLPVESSPSVHKPVLGGEGLEVLAGQSDLHNSVASC